MRSEVEILPLDLPGVCLADAILPLLRQHPVVASPGIGVTHQDRQMLDRLGQRLIGASSAVPVKDATTLGVDGIPEPSLVAFVAHIRPHLKSRMRLIPLGRVVDRDLSTCRAFLLLSRLAVLALDVAHEEGIDMFRRFF